MQNTVQAGGGFTLCLAALNSQEKKQANTDKVPSFSFAHFLPFPHVHFFPFHTQMS